MASASDIIKRWKRKDGIQPTERIDDVKKVLEYCKFKIREARKHKYFISHPRILKDDCDALSLRNTFTIPTKGGKKVKKTYIEKIVKYIGILEEKNELDQIR